MSRQYRNTTQWLELIEAQPELEAKGWRSRLPLEELVHRNGWGAGLDDEALLEQLKQ